MWVGKGGGGDQHTQHCPASVVVVIVAVIGLVPLGPQLLSAGVGRVGGGRPARLILGHLVVGQQRAVQLRTWFGGAEKHVGDYARTRHRADEA